MSDEAKVLTLEEINQAGIFSAEILTEDAQDGSKLSKAALNKIRKHTRSDLDESKIVAWPILAIDTAPTRNKVIYSAESQKKTVKRWIGTTFLFNSLGSQGIWEGGPDHKLQAASQVARIFDAQLVKTPKGETGTLLWVYSVREVSQQTDEFINKVEAGILKEVSIHIAIPRGSGIQCSICKVPFADDKNDHWPGQMDGKKEVYAETVGVLEPLELSAVACPGSVNAHVMQDDEVEDYPVLSLREALDARGTMEAIMANAAQTKTEEGAKTAEQLAEEARVAAGAPPAQAEGTTPPAQAEGTTPPAETEEGKKTKKTDDPPADDADEKTQNGKPKIVLFEGKCPACKRDCTAESHNGGNGEITEAIKEQILGEYKEDVEARVTAITEACETKIAEAQAEAAKNAEQAAAYSEMFTAFCTETTDLAIAKGVKESADRDAYMAELSALSYQGVKVVRETLNAAANKTEIKRETLARTSKEAAQKQFGTTTVREDADGKKGTQAQRKLFTTKIGPQ